MHNYLLSVILPMLLVFAAAGFVAAEDVSLDAQFGNEGMVITNLSSGVDEATSVAVQPDGNIIVAGSSDNGLGARIAVIRYLPDGSIDNEFNFIEEDSLGTIYDDDAVHAIALAEDGTILLGGTVTRDGLRQGVIIKLRSNGQLDPDFGESGVAVISPENSESEIADVTIDRQARIVAAGFAVSEDVERPLIARLDAQGVLDTSFNENGISLDPYTVGQATGIVEMADGSYVTGGYSVDENGWRGLYLGRFQEDGSLSSQFGEAGTVLWVDEQEQLLAHDVGVTADNRIVLAGEAEQPDGTYRIMLARFMEDGQPDLDFSETGVLVHDIGLDSRVFRLIVLEDSSILAAGYQVSEEGKDILIIRYLASQMSSVLSESQQLEEQSSEIIDEPVEIIKISALSVEDGPMNIPVEPSSASRSEADIITTAISGSDEISNDLALSEEGSIYAAGVAGDENDSGIMVAKYSGLVGDGVPVGTTSVSVTEYYRIGTMPITNVTRVGATTGGNIVFKGGSDEEGCLEECEQSCEDQEEAENDTCISDCQTSCQVPTVTKRGVVFSVEPNPEYNDGDGEDGDGEIAVPLDGDENENENGAIENDVNDGNGDVPAEGLRRFFTTGDDYFVLQGQTDDGSGTGIYVSEIDEANPQTVYYVRAYAVLSDGSVIYGNEYVFKTNDSCFIATAAFGSIDMVGVQLLREFRNRYLMPYAPGRYLVHFYYHVSPPLADFIRDIPVLRFIVMVALTPAIALAFFLLNPTLAINFVLSVLLLAWYTTKVRNRKYGIIGG